MWINSAGSRRVMIACQIDLAVLVCLAGIPGLANGGGLGELLPHQDFISAIGIFVAMGPEGLMGSRSTAGRMRLSTIHAYPGVSRPAARACSNIVPPVCNSIRTNSRTLPLGRKVRDPVLAVQA